MPSRRGDRALRSRWVIDYIVRWQAFLVSLGRAPAMLVAPVTSDGYWAKQAAGAAGRTASIPKPFGIQDRAPSHPGQ